MEPPEEDAEALFYNEEELRILNCVERRLNNGEKFADVAHNLGMERRSLTRLLERHGWQGVYHNMSIGELKSIIASVVPLRRGGSNWGIRTVQAALRVMHLRVPRSAVRDALNELQPENMRRREVSRLFWGQYSITEAMHMWHMDSYDKLTPWNIRLHGGIDGGSHYLLWAVVAADKKAETIFLGYSSTVTKYGHPIRIRSDYANEHALVREDQERARPNVYKPYLTGSSVHNQRIEKFWRQIWTQVSFFYKHLLTVMEENGTLIIGDEWHKASLHAVFISALQRDVDQMVAAWNVHRICKITENGRFIPSHVPTLVFQPYERQIREIMPPLDSAATELRRMINMQPHDTNLADDNVAPNINLAPNTIDEIYTISQVVVAIRDEAYRIGESVFEDLDKKFELHLALTEACVLGTQAEFGLQHYLDTCLEGSNARQVAIARLLIQAQVSIFAAT